MKLNNKTKAKGKLICEAFFCTKLTRYPQNYRGVCSAQDLFFNVFGTLYFLIIPLLPLAGDSMQSRIYTPLQNYLDSLYWTPKSKIITIFLGCECYSGKRLEGREDARYRWTCLEHWTTNQWWIRFFAGLFLFP